MKKIAILIASAILLAAFALTAAACDGCGGDNPPPASKAEISLDSTTLDLDLLESATLIATTRQTLESVTWSSDKPDVVSVAADGKTAVVTANAVGTAVVTATVEGKTATCAVTVSDRGSKAYIKLNNCDGEITLFAQDTFAVDAVIVFQGSEQAGQITLASSDEKVVAVSGKTLTAGSVGQAVITLTGTHAGNAVKTYVTVKVIPVPAA